MKSLLQTLFILLAIVCGEGAIFSQETKDLEMHRSDSLFAGGVDLYKAGRFKEAISCFSESDRIDKAVLDTNSNRREYSAMWLASCYYHAKDTLKAAEIYEHYYLDPPDRRLTVESDSLSAIGYYYYGMGDLQQAAEYFTRTAEIERKVLGETSHWFGNTADVLSVIEFLLGDKDKAIYWGTLAQQAFLLKKQDKLISFGKNLISFEKYNFYKMAVQHGLIVMEIEKSVPNPDNEILIIISEKLANCYAGIGNYTEAIKWTTQALEIRKKTLGEEDLEYASSLHMLALYYSNSGNYAEAIRIGTKAVEIRGKVLGEEDPNYATSLSNLALYYSNSGNYAEAIRIGTKAVEIRGKVLGEEDPNYATSLSNLAFDYSNSGNYAEAIRIGTKAVEIRRKVLGEDNPSYASSLHMLALYYSNSGNYEEAIRLGAKAVEIRKKTLGEEDPNYATSLSNLAYYYAKISNYAEAIRIETQALEIMKKSLGEENPNYVIALDNLAVYYSDYGNYEGAIKLGEEHPKFASSLDSLASNDFESLNYRRAITLESLALEIKRKTLGEENLSYAESLHMLSVYYSVLGNYYISFYKDYYLGEAISLETQAMEIYRKKLGEEDIKYVTSLKNLANYNYHLENYSEAITLATLVIDVEKKTRGEENPEYAQSLINLANYYSEIGNHEEAIKLATKAMEIRRKVLGKNDPRYAGSLNDLAKYYSKSGNYIQAIKLGELVIKIVRKTLGEDSDDYIVSLKNLAGYYYKIENYTEAIELRKKALEIEKKTLGEEDPYYAKSIFGLANYYSEIGNHEEAISLGKQALEILRNELGEDNTEYALSLKRLAEYYSNLGNHEESIKLRKQVIEIKKNELGEDDPEYAQSLMELAKYYSEIGNHKEALRLASQYVDIKRNELGEDNPEYALFLNGLALNYSKLGNYSEAIRLVTQAIEIIRNESEGEEPEYYALLLSELAKYYSKLGNYSEAIRLETQALEIRKNTPEGDKLLFANSLDILSGYYSAIGNYTEAIILETQALEISRKFLGEEDQNYATSLSNLAIEYSMLGNVMEAIKLEKQALDIRKKVLEEQPKNYAISLNNLACYNADIGNYTEAIKLHTQTLEIKRKRVGEEHPDYAASLNNLANCYYDIDNYPEAIKLQTQALDIKRKALGEENPSYATSLSNLACYYSAIGNYPEAMKLQTQALKIVREAQGEEHPDYAISLRKLSWYYASNKDEIQLSSTSSEATTRTAALIKKTFSDLTSSERVMFWEQHKIWFETASHRYAYQFPNTSLISNAYNSALLSKGLLLNSDIAFNQLILESGDTVAVKMYEQLRMSRLQLNRLLEKPIVERTMNTDSLQNVVSDQEKALVARSKVYGDFTKNLVIDWKQVQEKLGKKDIAVEFVSFPLENDSTMYAAYTLRKGWKNPKMTVLFEEKQLKAIPADSLYVSPAVSQLVWGPLVEDLSDADNIYFSPGGELYNIAIEYVPDAKTGKPYSEIKKLHRLSSTRELALIKEDNEAWKSAAVYGGLKYNMNGEDIITDSHRARGVSLSYASVPSLSNTSISDLSTSTLSNSLDSLHIFRDRISYLPGTLVEAENVARSLEQAHVSTVTYTDTLGTEPSFKALSGKRTNVLHIGTHGFYWNESEAHSAADRLSFLRMDNDRQGRYVEDKALTRSGLLMAGANWALAGKYLPDGVDDGILTAKELTALDLRGLDLVVMSACQTGLGEITGDGVFGLQRGFKKAGANSLLMSLWKVDDDATQMLMTRFFDNLSHKMSKYEALKEAQQHLQDYTIMVEEQPQSAVTFELEQNRIAEEKEKTFVEKHPYAAPRFWAAFILVDGIR